MPAPLLIFSDAVTASSGLARIARDLATRIAAHLPDVFRVATIGYGGPGSTRLPFPQYSWTHNDEWIIHDLPEVWKDFAGDEYGVMMAIQDPSRMLWFAHPQTCSDKHVAQFLISPPFRRWGYFPIDACGPNGKLSVILRECLRGYDRVLAYSAWAEGVICRTCKKEDVERFDLAHLPHGVDGATFQPRDRKYARLNFGAMTVGIPLEIGEDELLIGIVATNQSRKDFGMAIAVVAQVAMERKVRLWIHTDALDRYWSIPNLLADYNLPGTIVTLKHFDDERMSYLYSACDVTLGIGLGEGFGYPIFESMACGTPCLHGNYGGAPEWMPKHALLPPIAFRTEGMWNCVRPVFMVEQWAKRIISSRRQGVHLPPALEWSNLWPQWEQWLRRGL